MQTPHHTPSRLHLSTPAGTDNNDGSRINPVLSYNTPSSDLDALSDVPTVRYRHCDLMRHAGHITSYRHRIVDLHLERGGWRSDELPKSVIMRIMRRLDDSLKRTISSCLSTFDICIRTRGPAGYRDRGIIIPGISRVAIALNAAASPTPSPGSRLSGLWSH